MNESNIVIIGGWNTDMIVQAPRIPKSGQIIQIVKNAKLLVIFNLARKHFAELLKKSKAMLI